MVIATSEFNVKGNWENIVKFAAVVGALTPEVQEATIAARYVKAGSKGHNADRVEFEVSDENLAKEALSESGFEENGYTLIGGKIILMNPIQGQEYHDPEFDNKIELLIDNLEKKGVNHGKPRKEPIQFEYIERNRRAEILTRIEGDALRFQQGGSGLRDVISRAQKRNDEFIRERDEYERNRADNKKNNGGDGQDEGGSRSDAGGSVLEENKSAETQDFFTQVEEGKHRPKKQLEFVLPLTKALEKVYNVWKQFKGFFDEHIETNIPVFRDIQLRKIAVIASMFPNGGRLIDLGGSTGSFGKTITILNPKIKTINLDANDKMKERHEMNPVEGAEFVKGAFFEGFDDVEAYKPTEKFDVVHESMLFQFITWERGQFIDEIADNYLTEDGFLAATPCYSRHFFCKSATISCACSRLFSINHLCVSMPPHTTPARYRPGTFVSMLAGL
jgi:hypothetical protein